MQANAVARPRDIWNNKFMKKPAQNENNIQIVQDKINSAISAKEKKKQTLTPQKKQIFVSILLVLLGVSVTMLGLSIYSMFSPKADNFLTSSDVDNSESGSQEINSENSNSNSSNSSESSSNTMAENSELFYVQDQTQIYSYDAAAKKVTQWNNGSAQTGVEGHPDTDIENLKRIDANTLGFSRCDVVPDDYNCALYTLDLRSNQVSKRKAFGPDDLLNSVGWGGINKVGYINTAGKKWEMVVQDGRNKIVLKTIEDAMGGRGGSREDSRAIKFSPSSNKVFYIDTAPPDTGVDYTVYIYDLKTNQKLEIAEATQPAWLSDNEIVYRDINDQVLKVYNLGTQSSQSLPGAKQDAFYPQVLKNSGKILYETYPEKEAYVFNTQTDKNEKIADMAQGPVWISEKLIAYEELEPCPASGCEESYGGEPIHERSVVIFNLDSKQKLGYLPNIESTWSLTSHLQN